MARILCPPPKNFRSNGEIMANDKEQWYQGATVNEKPIGTPEKDLLVEALGHEKHDCYLGKLPTDLQDVLYAFQQYATDHNLTGQQMRDIFHDGIATQVIRKSAIEAMNRFRSGGLLPKGITSLIGESGPELPVVHNHTYHIHATDVKAFANRESQTMIERRMAQSIKVNLK